MDTVITAYSQTNSPVHRDTNQRKDDEIILANQKELLEIGLGNMVETISVWYMVGFDGWKHTSHNLFWFLVY